MDMTWQKHSDLNLILYHPFGCKYSTKENINMKSVGHMMLMLNGFMMYENQGHRGKKVNFYFDTVNIQKSEVIN